MAERQRISSGGPWEERIGYSRAVRVGDHIWVSGCTGTRADGSVPEGVTEQARVALDTVEGALGEAGSGLSDAVMVRTYVLDIEEWKLVAHALV
jgi:enamine deaminase RidA (YjgF/YER057c/UK114 family)